MKRLLFTAAVFLLPGTVNGQCYSSSYYGSSYYNSYYTPTYYPPKIVTQFVPFVLPIFSAGYVPGVPLTGTAAATAAPAKQVAAPAPQTDPVLIEALKRLDARLGALEQQRGASSPGTPILPPTMPPAAPEPPAQPAPGDGSVLKATQSLVVNKCAKCHSESGQGNLTLVRGGQLVDLSAIQPQQKVQILIRTYSQDPKLQMPPPGKGEAIRDEEYALLAAWIAGRK